MSLYDQILKIYPNLTLQDFDIFKGTIVLQNDGEGDYIKSWTNENPQPTQEQLTSTGI
jgi:XkdW protein